MTKDIASQTGRFQDVAFKIFAIVGFISSIVTIFAWATGSSASLTALMTEKTIEVPQSLQLSKFTDEKYTLDNALKELANRYCSPVNVAYDGKKEKNYDYNVDACGKQSALYNVFRQISQLDGKPLLAYDITISNDGSEVADNIRVRSPIDVDISAIDSEGGKLKIGVEQQGRVFRIPALNPRETDKIRLVSTTPVPDDFENKATKPVITFAHGRATYRNFVYISGRYSGIAKFLDDLPFVFQALAVGFGALIITLVWLLPLSLIVSTSEKRKKDQSVAPDNETPPATVSNPPPDTP